LVEVEIDHVANHEIDGASGLRIERRLAFIRALDQRLADIEAGDVKIIGQLPSLFRQGNGDPTVTAGEVQDSPGRLVIE
jgi:hypothetical protein